jgi:parallel beta-helix repeat protein
MKNHTLASLGMLVVVLMVLALAVPAMADGEGNILRVGPGQDYEIIQLAVNDALPGSKIFVYPKIGSDIEEYVENVEIRTNNLQIIAQGGDVTVIPLGERTPGFKVIADHVTVRGFEIAGAVDAPGIVFQGSHNTFAENTIHFPFTDFQGAAAIQCIDEDGGSDYNTIESNNMSPWGGTGLSDLELEHKISYGIVIKGSEWSDAVNKGNVIKNNLIMQAQLGGIWVANGTGFQISGNSIEGSNQGSCISIAASNNAGQGHHRILENTIFGCTKSGILLHASNGTVLAHNHISDNYSVWVMEDCITLKADSGAALVYNHVISNDLGMAENGISLSADQDAAVNNNLIRDNVIAPTYVAGISLTTGADHNRILKNNVNTYHEFGVLVAGDNNLIVGNWIWNGRWTYEDTGVGNRWRNNSYVAPWE